MHLPKTLASLAYLYLVSLFGIELLLFSATVVLHIYSYLSADGNAGSFGRVLFYCNLAVFVPATSIGDEKGHMSPRNIFKTCPKQLRITMKLIALYSVLITCAQIMFPHWDITPESMPLLTSALFLLLDSMAFFILLSFLWWSPVSDVELVKRARKSLIIWAIFAGFFIAGHLGYLPHSTKHE